VSGKGPFDPRQEAPLLSAYVDGELDPADVARIEAHLAEHPETRREVEKLRGLKSLTDALRLREAPPEAWETFWESFYNRAERSVGWLLLALGAVLVGAWGVLGLVQALVGAALPLWVKGGVFALAAGLFVLLVSVVRERIYRRSRTRYRNVIR